MVVDIDGPPCQGNCPNRGCLEAVASGTALVREAALRGRASEPDTALGRALEDGRELTGALVTELAHDGDPVARDGARARSARALGVGLANLVNIFNPEVDRDRRRRDRGGRAAARAGARGDARARALPPAPRRSCASCRRAFGAEAGMLGAALLARDELGGGRASARRRPAWSSARRRSATSRTSRCACSRRCARPTSSPARTRAARACCSSATASQATLVSYHEHNERERARASWSSGCATARSSRWCRDAGMPLVSDPGFVLVQGVRRRGAGGRGAARAVARRSPRWWRAALPADALALRRLPAAQARRARDGVRARRETLVAFESPRRVGASLAVLAELDPERPVAVCRELTKLHEEVVRGTAAELAARYARRAAARRGRARRRRRRARPRPPLARGARRGAPARRGGREAARRRRASSPSSPACRRTRSTRR